MCQICGTLGNVCGTPLIKGEELIKKFRAKKRKENKDNESPKRVITTSATKDRSEVGRYSRT